MNTVTSLCLQLQSRLVARFHSVFTIDFELQSWDLCNAASLHEDLVDLFERRSVEPMLRTTGSGDGQADDAEQLPGRSAPARAIDLYEGDPGRSGYLGHVTTGPAAPAFQGSPA